MKKETVINLYVCVNHNNLRIHNKNAHIVDNMGHTLIIGDNKFVICFQKSASSQIIVSLPLISLKCFHFWVSNDCVIF